MLACGVVPCCAITAHIVRQHPLKIRNGHFEVNYSTPVFGSSPVNEVRLIDRNLQFRVILYKMIQRWTCRTWRVTSDCDICSADSVNSMSWFKTEVLVSKMMEPPIVVPP